MIVKLSIVFRFVGLAALILGLGFRALRQYAAPALRPDAQVAADRIAREIEQIRGLTFKQPVRVATQSVADFGEYVSRQLDKEVPESIRHHYGTIVHTLGLYRGPPIDFSSMMMAVMSSQMGAYYDPEKQSFLRRDEPACPR